MWVYINMLSFLRHIYSSRKTSVSYSKGETTNGGFWFIAGGLASEKRGLQAIWLRSLGSDDNTQIMS